MNFNLKEDHNNVVMHDFMLKRDARLNSILKWIICNKDLLPQHTDDDTADKRTIGGSALALTDITAMHIHTSNIIFEFSL